jgi:hypothetical protein
MFKYLLQNEIMGVIMTINCLQKISYIDIFNAYGLILLVVILLVNKNYLLFVFIFNFFRHWKACSKAWGIPLIVLDVGGQSIWMLIPLIQVYTGACPVRIKVPITQLLFRARAVVHAP